MLGFLSIGYYDLREKALFTSRGLLRKLISVACAASQEAGVSIAGILTSNVLPEDVARLFPSRLHVPQGERQLREIQCLNQYFEKETPSEETALVLRPGLGWMNKGRILDFVGHVRKQNSPYILSAKKLSSLENPFWNLHAAPSEFHEAGSIWEPVHSHVLVRKACDVFPDAYKSPLAQRSQDLKSIYSYDGALYACKPTRAVTQDGRLVRPDVFLAGPADIDETCLYEKLPIFEMNGFSNIQVEVLESILDLSMTEGQSAQ